MEYFLFNVLPQYFWITEQWVVSSCTIEKRKYLFHYNCLLACLYSWLLNVVNRNLNINWNYSSKDLLFELCSKIGDFPLLFVLLSSFYLEFDMNCLWLWFRFSNESVFVGSIKTMEWRFPRFLWTIRNI